MRLSLALLTALAAPAAAEPIGWTWMADVEHPVIDPSKGITTQTVTLSVLLDHDAAWAALAGTVFDTVGIGSASEGEITGWTVLNQLDELTGDLTTTDGVSLFNTHAGQLCTQGCDMSNPIDVFRFTWEVAEPGAYDVSYVTDTGGAVVWIGQDADTYDAFDADVLSEAQASWEVVPAPGACIAVGALALRRRRRGGTP